MDRTSKMVDLALVSKYYPVANYSYPRQEGSSRATSPATYRSSLGSNGSAPGLVEDDSESTDDSDYHPKTAAIIDSYWRRDSNVSAEENEQMKKEFPTLVPSPGHKREHAALFGPNGVAWPLQESAARQPRKPSASYSMFPKTTAFPPRTSSASPSWMGTRPQQKPERPPRPDSVLIASFLEQASPITQAFASVTPIEKPLKSRPSLRSLRPRKSSPQLAQKPLTPVPERPLAMAPEVPRPATANPVSCASRVPTPFEQTSTVMVIPSEARTGLPSPTFPFPVPPTMSRPQPSRPAPLHLEPDSSVSYFHFDSDDDDEEESDAESSTPMFRFMFHKRAESDPRRITDLKYPSKGRNRSKTAPTSPEKEIVQTPNTPDSPMTKKTSQAKKRQGDYFHRMLGRRSR